MKEGKLLKICVPVLCIVFFCCILYPVLNPHIKRIFTINNFKKDAEVMNLITQDWKNTDYFYMYIDRGMYESDIVGVGYKPGDNIIIQKNKDIFKYMFEVRQYQYIMKSDNAVYFTKYSSLGNGYGVAYSIDGFKPHNEFIISSEKLENFNGWYFYVTR